MDNNIEKKEALPSGGEEFRPDPALLLELVRVRIPFGKYAGRLLIDLPEDYLEWFNGKGWPEGPLGRQMALVYEMRVYGLEPLFDRLR